MGGAGGAGAVGPLGPRRIRRGEGRRACSGIGIGLVDFQRERLFSPLSRSKARWAWCSWRSVLRVTTFTPM